jgi:conjugative transfer pilus assembly protein TraH
MRSSLKKLAATALGLTLSASPASSDVATDLNDFWADLGGTANRTDATSFAGQSAGYYTLGNARLRGPSRDAQLFSSSPPSFAAGCGGIDFFAGSLSFISADELVQLSKAIAANGTGYAFDLALETISPVIAETMKDLRARLQDLNLNNINSCETAQGLVDTVVGRQSLAQNKICQRIGAVKGLFTDYSESSQECGTDPAATASTHTSLTDDEKEAVLLDTNIAWQVIRGERVGASDWLKTDDELSEMAMTLSGTVVIDEDAMKEYFAPLATDENTLEALYEGGQLDAYYECDEAMKCLGVTSVAMTIDSTIGGFRGRVEASFDALELNIANNTVPAAQDIALVNGSTIPIWRILNVLSAHSAGSTLASQRQPIIDLVATEFMLEWIDSIIKEVTQRARSSKLKGDDEFDLWVTDLQEVKREIAAIRTKNSQKLSAAIDIIERIQHIESAISARLGIGFGDALFSTTGGGT